MTPDDLRLALARAMQERAKEPLMNLPSLERVLVGSLGDAWPYLADAVLSAIDSMGYAVVPVKPTEVMVDAAVKAAWLQPCNDEAEAKALLRGIIWSAMLSAGRLK